MTDTATVSGRVYTKTRPRGFADWSPRPETIELIDTVAGILDEYRDYLPLTIRQIFYRLVGAHGYDKTEQAYSRLCEHLSRARRARLIPMSAIRDDGTIVQAAPGWDGPASFWAAVRGTAERYVHHLDAGQPMSVEAWIEAGGMVPQIARIGHAYGVDVYSAGGFDSLTLKHEAAVRIAERTRPTAVLHCGDFDPSGLSILDSVAEDVTAFVHDLGGPVPTFTRLAVIPEQIRRYRLPTAPQKATDRRGERMGDTVQAEALSPDQLAAEVRAAIESVMDLDALAYAEQLGRTERRTILATLDKGNPALELHGGWLRGEPDAVAQARADGWRWPDLHGQALVDEIRANLADRDLVCTGCGSDDRCHGDLILHVAAGGEP